jgi:hypothetical protein
MRRILLIAALGAAALAHAKLPPQDDAAKAKAAEAAAKTTWTNAVANYQLCKSMDLVAARYFAQAKKDGKTVSAPVQTPPCTDPGAFSYTPVASKPLEAAGAHSPPMTAAQPPSTTVPHAQAASAPKKP